MLNSWTIGKKLILSFLGLALVFLLSGLYAKFTIDEIRIKGSMYHKIIDNKDLIADILPPPNYIIESYLCAMDAATAEKDSSLRKQLIVRLQELFQGSGYFKDRIRFWEENLTNEEIRTVFLHEAAVRARNFYSIALGGFADAINRNEMEQAQRIFYQQLKPEYLAHRKAIDRVVALANQEFSALEDRSVKLLNNRLLTMGVLFVALIGLALALGVIISRGISRPITAGVKILEQVAQGDMQQSIPPALLNRGDEVGQMAASLSRLVTQLGGMIREVVNDVHRLTASSGELTTISGNLLLSAQDTSQRSISVATSAEQVNVNMQSVASATEQSSTNVSLVASSTEEMIAMINEIAQNADNARSISAKAVDQATLTSDKMSSLGDSARNIGRVTETITEISEQTNLLALNATIEAARAGEAGKGFAVVANEIKELARQTAAATVDIKEQIAEMQQTAEGTIKDIGSISEVIEEINTMISSIAAAVDEQTSTSREIAGSIEFASQGISEVNHNIAQSTGVISGINQEISTISQQSTQVETGSRQVQASAEALSSLARQLETIATKFNV
ncbi:methyl-accepting chemotaxis protein [Desulfobulbus rhabdoformis]|uniref:methyl-accepting chemotaxis protein n=1 Tax=Desulfobulbus rhabdoformis TaxID=34032 RepID=UPI0019655C59|nr:HAMP domain-containing methyl-accepting chemotaxis protein [Desulfobulbus rhabdoformis]MBM9615099.1 methyl-accepting chemotaxis protein [Desulfobulbus rhabdoformis]